MAKLDSGTAGEHIDYALFGVVLVAAVEHDILGAPAMLSRAQAAEEPHHAPGASSRRTCTVHPTHRSKSKPDADADADAVHVEIPQELQWENYVEAGYYVRMLVGWCARGAFHGAVEHPIPVHLLVTGSVPAGSGLSSSAAMVVASTLAFLAVNGKLEGAEKVEKGTLVKISMENEKLGSRYAASLLPIPHLNLKISTLHQVLTAAAWIKPPQCSHPSSTSITFYPALTACPTPLPGGAVLVSAHSLVVADKALTAAHNCNLCVVETLVGAYALALSLGLSVAGLLVGEDDAKGMDTAVLLAALRCVEGTLDALKLPN
ncbi:hypothetical protein C8R46DRAFT_1042061 [Mycena filopes]|nr:hypothetical protein C8R46DRAFT_1042061 [Mycena filopes]